MVQVIRKAQPSIEQVHIDRPLTNISVAYIQDQADYIAGEIFPHISVGKRSDKYFVYDKNDWFRDEAEKRADASESSGSGYNLSDDEYFCDVWAFHKDIGAQTAANEDEVLNSRQDATEFVTRKLLIRRENLFVDQYFSATPWDNDETGGASGTSPDFVQWSDKTDSSPIDDVAGWKRTIKNSTGFMPNTFGIGGNVWDKLRRHPDIIELVKYTQTAITLNPGLVAQALDIDTLVIGEGVHATNEEGAATETYEQIMDDDGLLAYVNPRPRLRQPSAGYIFDWTGYGGTNSYGVTIATIPVPLRKAERVEGEMTFDMKVVGADLGFFLSDLIE